MKSLKKAMAITALLLFITGSAMAIPITHPGYNTMPTPHTDWTISGNMDFWEVTDLSTNIDGTGVFEIILEEAAYESAFGLYTVDSILNPTSVVTKFEIFAPSDEHSLGPWDQKTITFWNDNGNWNITDAYTGQTDTTSWTAFDSIFGFYFDIDAGNDGDIDYSFYTANNLNTDDSMIEHILTEYNPNTKSAVIYLEDLLKVNADWDWQDMVVSANDVQPIPEPASMMLFGIGLAGMATITRRKLNSK